MRYIRFLKTPRVAIEKGTSRNQISCLVTITSDLGDSFLPYDIQLVAEVLSLQPEEEVAVWRTVQWKAGMRSLPITFPLKKSSKSSEFRIRVGVEPKAQHDEYFKLSEEGACGVVSAWSQLFGLSATAGAAEKLVIRRFKLPSGLIVSIYEETGESIARHLWDAGIAISCHMRELFEKDFIAKALLPPGRPTQLRILELGTGCGMVGITIAQLIEGARVLLTDLPEAQEIVKRNIDQAPVAKDSTLDFQELNWDVELPQDLQQADAPLDLVIAADCTYNSDSSPALVQTLCRLAEVSPKIRVAIAMKMRHSSEKIFFDLMAERGFLETIKLDFQLPGDVESGEEMVYLYIYQYKPSV